MTRPILEVCVDSFESAIAAIRGGADRLELCSCLMVGGLTPESELLGQIREVSDIPIRCLMRPRFGDFCYTQREKERMVQQIKRLSRAGADGFVIGCLDPDGNLDLSGMQLLIQAASGSGLTLHRAFDVCRDGLLTARQAVDLGIDTILTSGQASCCLQGIEYLQELLRLELPLTIMPGAGVNAEVIAKMKGLGFGAFHMSGKKLMESRMKFRRPGVPMGAAGLDEFSVWQTDEEQIRQAVQVLQN